MGISPFIFSFFVSFLATPLTIRVYRKLKLLELPNPNKPMTTHEYAVPRGGGIPVFLSIFFSLLLFAVSSQYLLGILGGICILTVVGVLDDQYNLNPYVRLALLFFAAAVVVAAGIGIPFFTIPFLGIVPLDNPKISFSLLGETRHIWILADLFALVWMVSLANFVNWSKGLDGQLPGIVIIASLTVGALALRTPNDPSQFLTVTLALIVAGAYAGFLPWNFYPQKIMPGYGGGTLGGFLLAIMAILSTAKVGTLLVVLGIPLIDAGYTIVRRLARGKSPVWGDRGHLHHHLLDNLRWSKRKIAVSYWVGTAILGAIALRLNSQQKFYTMLGVTLVIGGVLLWLTHFGQSSRPRGRSGG